MSDVNLVLNADSSSLKFSMFLEHAGSAPQLELRGQIEGLFTEPRLSARNVRGAKLAGAELASAAQQRGHRLGAAHQRGTHDRPASAYGAPGAAR